MSVVPEPMRVGSFFMKTASAFNVSGNALHSRFRLLLRFEPIAQKVEPLFSFADVIVRSQMIDDLLLEQLRM